MLIREFSLDVSDFKLSGSFYLPGEDGIYPTVCLCHGIPSGEPAEPGDGGYPALAEQICRAGFAAVCFNFRGCRTSGGNFDILGWTEDVTAVLDYLWLQPEVDRSKIALFGFSAGAAVAICVGARDINIAAVAACASPAEWSFLLGTPEEMVAHFRQIGIIRDSNFPESPEEWLDNFKTVDPLYYVTAISPRPLLIVHGDKDELVNVEHARKLYDRAGQPKKLVILEGAGHRLRRNELAIKTILEWLNQTLK
jgi:dipeptidyl aminopeptidase/acylaminoacyl peptidase